MASFSTIRDNGQVTIPRAIQESLGLHEGDRVEFVVEGERTILRPAAETLNPFDEFVGAFPAFGDAQEINQWVRDLRG